MYCFKCGAKVPDGAKFCSSCGAQLIDDPSAKEPAIPEEIRSEPSVAPDSKMTQVEEVSEDTKVQGTSEELPKKKSTVKSIIELVLGAVILVAFLLSATGVLDKQLSGKIGSYVMFFEDNGSYTIGDDDGNDIIAMTFGRGYNIEWTTLNDNVTHRDVDLDKGRLNIMESKQHRSRIVMMADDVVEMLSNCNAVVSAVMPGREPFFPNTEGGFYGKRGLEKTFRPVLKKAGVTGTGRRSPRLYDFRHTFATHRLYHWMNEGKDLNVMIPYLSAYMGHAQLSDTYYYIHLVPGLLEEMSGFTFSSAEAFLPEVGNDE